MTNTVQGTENPDERCCIAAPLDDPHRVRLHLLDLDNLHSSARPTKAIMHLVRANYGQIGYGPHDLGYAACNHRPARKRCDEHLLSFHLTECWSPFTIRLANGPDGADRQLITDAETFLPTQNSRSRFTDVIIGSGDHIFAPLAFRFRKAGITVHAVVPTPKSLASDLRTETNGCIWLLGGGRCQRHNG